MTSSFGNIVYSEAVVPNNACALLPYSLFSPIQLLKT